MLDALIAHKVVDPREKWIRKIAQCHWSFTDLRSGACWQHMKRFVK